MHSNWLNFRYILALALTTFILQLGSAQGWVATQKGMSYDQDENNKHFFQIRFETNGPLNKDWMYGSYWDEDTLPRVIAYREGGTWVPLPFYFSQSSTAGAIGMYGDTLYILGEFANIYNEIKGAWLPPTNLIKWYNDSIWVNDPMTIFAGPSPGNQAIATKGDTIIMAGMSYYNPPQLVTDRFMSSDEGATWQYPYTIIHPTATTASFGPIAKLRILDNGDILTLNNTSSSFGTTYDALARWDGQQWHGYGKGIQSLAGTGDFEFYKGELYMAGSFNTAIHPDDPGKLLARWDGSQWHDVGGGLEGTGAGGLFVHDTILYCGAGDNNNGLNIRFGDAAIPYLAGWDGHRWCGTPQIFVNNPPSRFAVIKDTLYAAFYRHPGSLSGDKVYMMYFDGDYLHGPNSICSSYGLGQEEEPQNQPQISIYPNPASSKIQVALSDHEVESIKVYGLSGQVVLEHVYKRNRTVELDVSILPKGIYLIQVNGLYNQRFVKD